MNGFDSVTRKLKKVKANLSKDPDMAVQRELRKVRRTQYQHIVSNNSVASGVLINGLKVRATSTKTGTQHSILSTAPHSGFVEFGTGPRNVADQVKYTYKAPVLTNRLVSNIKAWMIMKGVSPMTGDMDQSAFLIARRISRTQYEGRTKLPGTDAQPFFFNSMWKHEPQLKQAVRNAVKKSLRV